MTKEYIEREAVIDLITRRYENPEICKAEINAIHAADVDPVRHGKWLEWFPEDCALIMTGEEMLYQCSSCDAKYYDAEGYKYCPNCGCRMDGGDDE